MTIFVDAYQQPCLGILCKFAFSRLLNLVVKWHYLIICVLLFYQVQGEMNILKLILEELKKTVYAGVTLTFFSSVKQVTSLHT